MGEQLCAVLSDPSSKAEVAQKLSQVDKMHSQLQKKLDNRRAELENLLKDNREFEDQCGQLQEWLGDCGRLLVEALRVSADRDILRRQLQDNDPAYKDVMDREHEVIMMLDKGQELANQTANKFKRWKLYPPTKRRFSKRLENTISFMMIFSARNRPLTV